MKILIVIDQFDDANNGTTISAKRFAKGLEDRGHEVFVVSTGKEGPKKYRVKELKLLPIASHIVHSQGMSFAVPSKEVLEKAISNGVEKSFYAPRREKEERFQDKFLITMVGRYSNEKRQDVLIDAVYQSKYEKKIQLILAGKGPSEGKYRKLAEKLTNPPIFQFMKKEELIATLTQTDLYVHTADAEIEAISCIEAIACGNVPIIASSEKSATPQFALGERSLFEAGNSKQLAQKIDAWIEDEEERKRMQKVYVQSAEKYHLENSMKKMEEMFCEAIQESRK